jgi:hypothetical protein
MKTSMNKKVIVVLAAALFTPVVALADDTFANLTKAWTYTHTSAGQAAEIVAFDAITNSLWVAGIAGVDVLNASNGSLIQHIDTSSFGSINSVAIHNGVAAFAIESDARTNAGTVKFYDTITRDLSTGVNSITVGALPDMLTFTNDGSKLLVANEGTPDVYGTRVDSTIPRNYGPAEVDPAGSVSIIDMSTRTLIATAGLVGVPTTGSNIRTNTGMDYEPEYIAVNAAGTKAYVTLQEANAIGVLDLNTNSFEKIIGLGAKDFSQPGNTIDTNNDGIISFGSANVKGLYMPDAIAAYEAAGVTYLVTANEGDFREDDADRSAGSTFGATGDLAPLRVVNTDSSPSDLYIAGTRDFTIRDVEGNIIYGSGDILDKKAAELGIYDDSRSRDKGVEPEGVELMTIGGKTFAFIGLERTTKSAIGIFDITDPANSTFLSMLVTDGDLAPEGMEGFMMGGNYYLAIANETSKTTTLYNLAPVPEPETYALLVAGLGLIGFRVKRRQEFLV